MALFMIFYKRKQGGVGVYDLLKYPIIYIDDVKIKMKADKLDSHLCQAQIT